jgi:hypothetical protein
MPAEFREINFGAGYPHKNEKVGGTFGGNLRASTRSATQLWLPTPCANIKYYFYIYNKISKERCLGDAPNPTKNSQRGEIISANIGARNSPNLEVLKNNFGLLAPIFPEIIFGLQGT